MTNFLDTNAETHTAGFGGRSETAGASKSRKIIASIAGVLLLLIGVGALGGYLYWRSFENTPQYSLAVLVDAARRHDQAGVDNVVSVDAIADHG
jgi:hypothetical protein